MDTQAEVCIPYQVLNQFFSIDNIEFPGNSFQRSNSKRKRFNLVPPPKRPKVATPFDGIAKPGQEPSADRWTIWRKWEDDEVETSKKFLWFHIQRSCQKHQKEVEKNVEAVKKEEKEQEQEVQDEMEEAVVEEAAKEEEETEQQEQEDQEEEEWAETNQSRNR